MKWLWSVSSSSSVAGGRLLRSLARLQRLSDRMAALLRLMGAGARNRLELPLDSAVERGGRGVKCRSVEVSLWGPTQHLTYQSSSFACGLVLCCQICLANSPNTPPPCHRGPSFNTHSAHSKARLGHSTDHAGERNHSLPLSLSQRPISGMEMICWGHSDSTYSILEHN